MWSNDRFSSIKTTMWSIFARLLSVASGAGATYAGRVLRVCRGGLRVWVRRGCFFLFGCVRVRGIAGCWFLSVEGGDLRLDRLGDVAFFGEQVKESCVVVNG